MMYFRSVNVLQLCHVNLVFDNQRGYEELQSLIPTCAQTESIGSTKLSKAAILQRCEHFFKIIMKMSHFSKDQFRNKIISIQTFSTIFNFNYCCSY